MSRVREIWVADKVWVWMLVLLGLSTVDAYLTNRIYGIAGEGTEANPLMSPFVGTWALYLKGVWAVLGITVLGMAFGRWVAVKRVAEVVCVAMCAVCVWNAYSLGLVV